MQQARARNDGAMIAPAGSRTESESQLTDKQWFLICDLFVTPAPSPQGGRPRLTSRSCVEGILWVLRTGARWKDLPTRFPSPTTCWRRHRQWTEDGTWQKAWARLLRALDGQGRLDWEETTADGTFSSAKKVVSRLARPNAGKGTKIMVHSEGHGLPVAATIASASPHEVTLIEPLLAARVIRRKPRRLLYDKAADSDPLRARLARRRIELVCRHRENRRQPPTQDGRKVRRIRRRWKIERAISWLQNFRRLVTRYEYHAHLFLGFVQAACMMILLKRF
jgi:transposase